MGKSGGRTVVTVEEIKNLVAGHTRIKVGGCDIDGITRGKVISTDKFVKSLEDGFGNQGLGEKSVRTSASIVYELRILLGRFWLGHAR